MSTLAARALACRRGKRTVLESIDVAFAAGQVTAIVGPNGAGKTTLLRHLAGLDSPAAGQVELDGTPLGGLRAGVRARRIAYLPQGASAYWPLLGRDLVALGRLPHGANLERPLAASDVEAVERALRRVDGLAFADRTVDALSQGERARMMLARVLATDARVLLLDEPVASLDPAQALAMMQVLVGEARRGKAVAVVMHDLVLAARFADHVVFLKEGMVAAEGAPNEVFEPETVSAVYGVAVRAVELDGHRLVLPWVDGAGASP